MRLRWWTCKLDAVSCKGSNPTVDKTFSFCYFRLVSVPRAWTGRIYMKSSMTFIRRNRCIEREGKKDTFKNDGDVKRL